MKNVGSLSSQAPRLALSVALLATAGCTGVLTLPTSVATSLRPSAVSLQRVDSGPEIELATIEDLSTTVPQVGSIVVRNLPISGSFINLTGSGLDSTGTGAYPSTPVFNVLGATDLPNTRILDANRLSDSYVSLKANATFPSEALPTCDLLGPLANLSCLIGENMQIPLSDLATTDTLQIRAYSAGQNPSTQGVLSQSLVVKRNVFQQLANFEGDQSASDGTFYAYNVGSKIVFIRVINSGSFFGTKLYAINEEGELQKLPDISGDPLVTDGIYPYSNHAVYNGMFYFVAWQSPSTYKLCATDGENIYDISSGLNNIEIKTVFQGKLYFVATESTQRARVYRTDGDTIKRVLAVTSNSATDDFPQNTSSSAAWSTYTYNGSFAVFDDKLYITPYVGLYKTRLTVYDGTNYTKVSNISPDSSGDFYDNVNANFAKLGSNLIFAAYDNGQHGKLMKYDGSSITLLSNTTNSMSKADFFSSPYFTEFKNYLYFTAPTDSGASKFYRTNGTVVELVANASGDFSVTDNPGTYGQVFEDQLYLSLKDGAGEQGWYRTNGSASLERLSINGVTNTGSITFLYKGPDWALVSAPNAQGKQKLYRFDGSSLVQMFDMNGPNTSDYWSYVLADDDTLYLSGPSSSGGTKLYKLKL
jgi:hypothetical protein